MIMGNKKRTNLRLYASLYDMRANWLCVVVVFSILDSTNVSS